jgi:hypothetical protein
VLQAISQLEYRPHAPAAELARRGGGVPRLRGSYQRASDDMNRLRTSYSSVDWRGKPRKTG